MAIAHYSLIKHRTIQEDIMNNLRRFIWFMVFVVFLEVPSIGEQKKDVCLNDSVFTYSGQVIAGIIVEDHPGNNSEAFLKIQIGPNQVRDIHYNTIRIITRCDGIGK